MSLSDPKAQLARRIDQAMGREPADVVVKGVDLLDVVTGETRVSDIAITGSTIVGTLAEYEGREEIDGRGLTAVPGFIDAHVHVESSMITPYQFDRCVLPRGTTTAVCDPHEISNVLGEPALDYFLAAAEHTVMDLMVQLSSCVPATPLETSGARLDAQALVRRRHHPRTIGLAEFMDIGGVLGKNPDTLDKLAAFQDGHVDGHLPGIVGRALNAMAACGVRNCHESTTACEALEKLAKGVQVLIREGTVCKDLAALHPFLTTRLSPFLGFCTDDRNPLEIAREGHIDHLVRQSIRMGAAPHDVYRVASWSAAQGFGLHLNTPKWRARGLIAPGYQADIVLLEDPATCGIRAVLKNGRLVGPESFRDRPHLAPVGYASLRIRALEPSDFQVPAGPMPVIGLEKGNLVTRALDLDLPVREGRLVADPGRDLLKIAVIERHGKNGNIACGFIRGFGFSGGAIAGSVGHDSHNLTVVGATDADMALAANTVRANQGGYAAVRDGEVLGSIALPLAGLMSDKPFEQVREELAGLRAAVAKLGGTYEDPTMVMAFMPLCVIPEIKITDFGLVRFDPARDQAPVLIQDQRGMRLPACAG